MYRIIGADGREYGPATIEQLRQWIAEGRVNARTQALAPGGLEWRPLGALPEFAQRLDPSPPPVVGEWPAATPVARARKTNGFAITGLIFGILSLTCCCSCPFSILGLTFSIIGWSQINQHPELYEGRGLAVVGIILSVAGLLLGFGLGLLSLMPHPGNFEWHYRSF